MSEGTSEGTSVTRLTYRLLTGPDDRSFCEKISDALADGYLLYGSPSIGVVDGRIVAAQAVVLPGTGSAAQGGGR